MGSGGMGSTFGAFVRGVIELQKGDQLYFMVGQAGSDACAKVSAEAVDSSINRIFYLQMISERKKIIDIIYLMYVL